MRRPFLNACVAALAPALTVSAAALLLAGACETPRGSPPVNPARDDGGAGSEGGVVRGGAPAGEADAGPDPEPDAPAAPDAAPDVAPADTDRPDLPGGCAPGSRRCGTNQAAEVCSAGGSWQALETCLFLCTGAGQCTGECVPGRVSCAGSNLRTCREDGNWAIQACPGRSNGTPVCRNEACDYECKDAKFPHRCSGGCCECERDGDCPAMADQGASCAAGRCTYKPMCDLARRTWTMSSGSPCPTSIWAFTRRSDGRWDAKETGCGNATGIASYDGTLIRLDFTYDIGAGRYTWPVDGRCVGTRGTLAFTSGPNAGEIYPSTLTAN